MNVQRGWYGQRLAATHNLVAPPTLVLKTQRGAAVAVTRMRSHTGLAEASAPLPADKAVTVHLQLQELKKHEVWIERRRVYAEPYQRGAVTIIDLQRSSFAYVPAPFDALNFYVPLATLNEYAYGEGLRRIDTVACSFGTRDPVIEHIGGALLPFLDEDELPTRLFLDQIHQALCAHILVKCARVSGPIRPSGRGLAPWQKRRAEEILIASLLSDISVADVAEQCNVSPGHFSNAFKRSFGTTPHRWLEQRRIDAVKDRLLHSRLSLEDIAVACGFRDAASLIRSLRRIMGTSPGKWRRHRLALGQ
jgi:AraC family transcriptional regulator